MVKQLRPAIVLLVGFTVLVGIIYPAIVTGLAQSVFPRQANGSIIRMGQKAVGSELLGQAFTEEKYFWPRPSAATPPYNGAAGGGSNLAVSNPALAEAAKVRIAALVSADPENKSPIPVDLITASGSGLDPHISPAAAEYQIARVARARRLDEAAVRKLVQQHTESRDLGLLGEDRVNVLKLNLALNAMSR